MSGFPVKSDTYLAAKEELCSRSIVIDLPCGSHDGRTFFPCHAERGGPIKRNCEVTFSGNLIENWSLNYATERQRTRFTISKYESELHFSRTFSGKSRLDMQRRVQKTESLGFWYTIFRNRKADKTVNCE